MSELCLSCGACCATYRVSFYWAESDAHPHGTVPEHLTTPINSFYVAMRGTEYAPVRCIALTGEVGCQVSCSIYTQRSSTCHSVMVGDEQCLKARQRHQLSLIPVQSVDI